MSMRRLCPLPVLILVLAAIAASAGGSSTASAQGRAGSDSAATRTIKIAAIHPQTGVLALDGVQMNKAAMLAVDQINAAGGIKSLGGAKLELLSGDSQAKPDVAQTEGQRVVDSGALAIIGTFQSATAASIANLAERSRVPFVIDVAVDDALINDQSRYTFRVGPNATAFGRTSARYLDAMGRRKGQSLKKIAYMHEQTAFGAGVFAGFKAEAERLGMAIVLDITYNAFGAQSFTTELTRVSTSGADVLVTTGYFADGVRIARDASAVAPRNIKVYYGASHGAYSQAGFVAVAGAASELVLDTDYYWNWKNKRVPAVLKAFTKTYGASMRTSAMMTYQSVEVIADAMERAGRANPRLLKGSNAKIRAALRTALSKTKIENSLMAFEGPIAFDATGENRRSTPVVLQVQGGKAKPVWPAAFARTAPIIPGVPWNKP